MTGYVTFAASSAAYRGTKKPHVAKILALGGKYGFDREFLANPARVFEPTLVEVGNVDKKDRKDSHFAVAVLDEAGVLQKSRLREETVVEILQADRPLSDLRCRPYPDGDGYTVRADGTTGPLLWTVPSNPNPLAAFSDDEIRAEFERRGL